MKQRRSALGRLLPTWCGEFWRHMLDSTERKHDALQVGRRMLHVVVYGAVNIIMNLWKEIKHSQNLPSPLAAMRHNVSVVVTCDVLNCLQMLAYRKQLTCIKRILRQFFFSKAGFIKKSIWDKFIQKRSAEHSSINFHFYNTKDDVTALNFSFVNGHGRNGGNLWAVIPNKLHPLSPNRHWERLGAMMPLYVGRMDCVWMNGPNQMF